MMLLWALSILFPALELQLADIIDSTTRTSRRFPAYGDPTLVPEFRDNALTFKTSLGLISVIILDALACDLSG